MRPTAPLEPDRANGASAVAGRIQFAGPEGKGLKPFVAPALSLPATSARGMPLEEPRPFGRGSREVGWRSDLRVETPHRGSVGHALNGQQVRGHAHVHALAHRYRQRLAERPDHDLVQLLVDHLLAPVVAVQV